jgi:murein DD-endopeptidase MepM/ murein hydrolase activator NlpD
MRVQPKTRATFLLGVLTSAVVQIPPARAGAWLSTMAGQVPGPEYGAYVWPVRGPVIYPFEAPDSPYGAGHRGIDIAAPVATPVLASGPGRVAFAGPVAGGLFVSVDHPDGVRTTYSWLRAVSVRRGDAVRAGQPIGATGPGHPGRLPPHLHFGARVGDVYIDPLLLLEGASVVGLIRLAPVDASMSVAARRITLEEPRGPPSPVRLAPVWSPSPPAPRVPVRAGARSSHDARA